MTQHKFTITSLPCRSFMITILISAICLTFASGCAHRQAIELNSPMWYASIYAHGKGNISWTVTQEDGIEYSFTYEGDERTCRMIAEHIKAFASKPGQRKFEVIEQEKTSALTGTMTLEHKSTGRFKVTYDAYGTVKGKDAIRLPISGFTGGISDGIAWTYFFAEYEGRMRAFTYEGASLTGTTLMDMISQSVRDQRLMEFRLISRSICDDGTGSLDLWNPVMGDIHLTFTTEKDDGEAQVKQ